ncbi:hypothetical protein HJG60_011596 [Phyllostomus discolor]|uniref:Uncharacterized protein n=1 Tax=Phyllostomus discolor TaxID=89673 RepID=A0A833ZZA4_9CHIR|nr:hypothetical protein HJG60_011596 [Phyllostomus discolor]
MATTASLLGLRGCVLPGGRGAGAGTLKGQPEDVPNHWPVSPRPEDNPSSPPAVFEGLACRGQGCLGHMLQTGGPHARHRLRARTLPREDPLLREQVPAMRPCLRARQLGAQVSADGNDVTTGQSPPSTRPWHTLRDTCTPTSLLFLLLKFYTCLVTDQVSQSETTMASGSLPEGGALGEPPVVQSAAQQVTPQASENWSHLAATVKQRRPRAFFCTKGELSVLAVGCLHLLLNLPQPSSTALNGERESTLTAVAQWDGRHSVNHKVSGSIPGQGTSLGCGPGPRTPPPTSGA